MKKLSLLLSLFLLTTGSFTKSYGEEIDLGPGMIPKVYVVEIFVDTCPECATITPKVERLRYTYSNHPVLFVRLDYSNFTTSIQANLLASALGIQDQVKSQSKSGLILMISPETGETLKSFDYFSSLQEMKTVLNKSI